MNLNTLLHRGYFPKELPPPFETTLLAKKISYINKEWEKVLADKKPKDHESNDVKTRYKEKYIVKYDSSSVLHFSLSKGVFSRRKLGIPNPKQFIELSKALVQEWSTLISFCKESPYSQSTPIQTGASRSVRTKSTSWNEFKFLLIEKSLNKKYQLRIDISQFYPSIYTHSIPWAILGKDEARKLFKIKNNQKKHWEALQRSDDSVKLFTIADKIDKLIRNCNEKQSVGLPIGPDTSLVLAECIATRIDLEIKKRLKNIAHEGIRYYDDFYFYINSRDEAEETLKIIQQVLNEYQLESNESKIQISPLPFSFIEDWNREISSFKFYKSDRFELRGFFSLMFNLLHKEKSNSSWIVRYALGRFEYGNVKINRKAWDTFLSFLLKTVFVDPSNLDQIFKIILSYKPYLNARAKEKIGLVLNTIIIDHLALNHSFEVSWSLWILKSLKISCPITTINKVLNSEDSISKIICLDIIHAKLYVGRKPGLTKIANQITGQLLTTDEWLFAYETFKKQWADFKKRDILSDYEFFKVLVKYDVSFYNPDNQVETYFSISDSPAAKPKKTRKPEESFYSYIDSDFEIIDPDDVPSLVINDESKSNNDDDIF